MSYRCRTCGEVVPHGVKRLVHVVVRPRKVRGVTARGKDGLPHMEVAQEVPTCRSCWLALQPVDQGGGGLPLQALMAQVGARRRINSGAPAFIPKAPLPHWRPRADAAEDAPPTAPSTPRCDLCGGDATGGQVTDHTVLCPGCLRNLDAAVTDGRVTGPCRPGFNVRGATTHRSPGAARQDTAIPQEGGGGAPKGRRV